MMRTPKKTIRSYLSGLAGLVLGAMIVGGQTPTPQLVPVETEYDFYAGRTFRGTMERPEDLLGYEPGDSYADYGEFLRLLETYTGQSDRAKLLLTGDTNERRPMHVVAISSPRNLARLEEIKATNRRLADGRLQLSDRERDRLIASQPIIVWLAYNIHGDESAGLEAAMRVMYHLLDSEDETVARWLDEAVILLNPCQNPDGTQRFVTWARTHGIGRAETFAWEKENPWNVKGRLNHYYFDLNRDMISLSQRESQNSAAAFQEWMPQVSVDHHGEVKEYFFPPAALPINPNLPGDRGRSWMETFGRGTAAAFDAQSWMYYVRDEFDLFYPGYWDSWPALQGATGMTFETTAGGKEGTHLRREDGTVTTLRTAIAKHFTASLSTIATAVENRETRLRDFREHFVSAVKGGRAGDLQQVFLTDIDAERRAQLGRVLQRSGVELHRLTQAVSVSAAQNYQGGEPGEQVFPAGTWFVDLAQPRGHLARALLAIDTPVDAEFLQRQLDKNNRNAARGENVPTDELEFYDLTAWTLPLMYGVEAFAIAEAVTVNRELLDPIPSVQSVAAPGRARSAYVIPVGRDSAQQVAFDLLQEGYRVATSTRPFDADGTRFERGAFIVRVERNPEVLHARIGELAQLRGATVIAVDTAFAETGLTGIGSEDVHALASPKILVAVGDGVSDTSYGAIKYLFEQTFAIDYVPVALGRIKSIDLRGFNVVILPSGYSISIEEELGLIGTRNLKNWVEAGGTLITMGGAVEFVLDAGDEWTSVKRTSVVGTESEPDLEPAEVIEVPGAFLRTIVDHEHYLSFGYAGDDLPFLVDTGTFFTASATGTNVLTFAEESLWMSGVVWPENTERLIAGTAAVIDEPVGQGHVVLFSDEPAYRALWYGTTRMLLNAILYGPALSGEASSYQP